ncbi:MAG: hypothetical protein JW862_02140 [Anaerolineales bacterium]|nr:hypothetical protein [Anaerolineales bacterium]
MKIGIDGKHLQGGCQVFNKQLLSLIKVIDASVAAVVVIGQLLHKKVTQVADTTDEPESLKR